MVILLVAHPAVSKHEKKLKILTFTREDHELALCFFRSRLPTEGWYPGPIASDVHGLSVCPMSDVRCLLVTTRAAANE